MQVYVQLVIAMFLYGVSFVSTKIVLTTFGPFTLLTIRLVLSSLFLVALDHFVPVRNRREDVPATGRVTQETTHRRWPIRSDIPAILLVALFEPILYFIAENNGLRTVSASIASIIIATVPVFTPLLAGPLLRERISPWGVLGLALTVGGVCTIVLERRIETEYTPLGLLLLFVAVVSVVAYSVAVRKAPARYRPLTLVKFQSIVGLPVLLVLALLFEGLPREVPPTNVILHVLYLGIFPSSIAFVFFSVGIKALGASRANVFTNLVPGFTAITAWVVVGEQFTVQKIVGMAIVVIGVLTAQRGSLTAIQVHRGRPAGGPAADGSRQSVGGRIGRR